MISLIIGIIIICIAGISKAIMDKLQFHYNKSIFKQNPPKYNQQFWNPLLSWQNKYKENSMVEPKFKGSTTFFVFVTDAWHLSQTVLLSSLFIGIALTAYNSETPLELIGKIIILRCFFGAAFELFFRKILAAKESF
jgi:hypothetical protein